MPSTDGWHPDAASSHDRDVPSGRLSLSVSHLYDADEPAILIQVSALVIPNDGKTYQTTLFDPQTAYLAVAGVRVPAEPTLRERPSMKAFWKHGGFYPVPANMNDGQPLVLTFPVRYRSGTGFTLHLGQFVIQGTPVAVPVIRFCYVPHRTTWTLFHG